MPVAHTENLADTQYDAGRRTGADGKSGAMPADGGMPERMPSPGEGPDVGLAQKGDGEAAIVRRETEI